VVDTQHHRPHVPVTRAPPLPRRFPGFVPGGGVGRKNPGGVCVLLANPRWERRFLKFLELSGARRVMDDGADEDAARAERLDGWIVWETEERAEREEMG